MSGPPLATETANISVAQASNLRSFPRSFAQGPAPSHESPHMMIATASARCRDILCGTF